MSKYNLLWDYVKKSGRDFLKLTFKEIENILGAPIDHSFLKYKKELSKKLYNETLASLEANIDILHAISDALFEKEICKAID